MNQLDRIASIICEQTRLTNSGRDAAEKILAEFTLTEREGVAKLRKRRNEVAGYIGKATYGSHTTVKSYSELAKSMQYAIDYIIELEDRVS